MPTNNNDTNTVDSLDQQLQEGNKNVDSNNLQQIADLYKPKELDKGRWDALWKSTILGESGGDDTTKESTYGKLPQGKRAYGIAQILPDTAKRMGFTEEEIKSDPYANFAAGVKYLGHNYSSIRKHPKVASDEHGLILAGASYFTGDTAVIRNLDSDGDGIPDVDDGGINARDYAKNLADRMRPTLDRVRAEESNNAIKVTEDIDNAATEAGLKQEVAEAVTQQPATQQTEQPGIEGGVISRQPRVTNTNQSTEQMFADANKNVRELLGLRTPDTHPHKMVGSTRVMIPFTPGQQVTADTISDAITDSLTGIQGRGQQFRAAIGENPGSFQDDITNEWLKQELEAGRIQYVPKDPNNPQAGGYLNANIPVQNYVKNRIDAFAAGGKQGVEENTAAMRKEIDESSRLVAEEVYGQQIAQLRQQASETKDEAQRQQLEQRAQALQLRLDKEYPTTNMEELWRGIKRGVANVFTEYQQLGLNLRNLAEAATDRPDAKEQARLKRRDEEYQNVINSLRRETPESRAIIGDVAETLTQAFAYDAPVYATGGAVLGPAGIVYTTAVRSAHKKPEELASDVAAALIEIPVSKGLPALAGKYLGGIGSKIERGAEESAIGRAFFGGTGEVAGDAIVDLINGKKFDAKQAFLNFVAGGAFEIGSKSGEGREGENPKLGQPRQFVQPLSPIAVAMGENGQPRFQLVIGNEEGQSLVEVPPQHPFVLKYQQEVEKGNLAYMKVSEEQFDKALNDFKGEGKTKLPTLTAEQTAEYLNAKSTVRSKESEKQDDSEARVEVRSEVQEGQKPVEAGKQEESRIQAATGGDVQTGVREQETQAQAGKEDFQIDVNADEVLRSAAEKLGTSSAREIGDLIEESNKRFRVSNTDEEQARADEAYAKVSQLTPDENQRLSGVLPARFFAPVRQPGKTEGDYSRSISDMEGESDAQLDANLREVAQFFKDRAVTDTTPVKKGQKVPEFEKEQKSIREGDKQVTVQGIKITLPKDIASQWQAADDKAALAINKLQGSFDEKTKERRRIMTERKQARLKLLNEYRQREEEQFERGFLRQGNRPVVVVERPKDSEFIMVRPAGSQEAIQVKASDVVTTKERAIKPIKKGKLPLLIRARRSLGAFEEDKPRTVAKDGVVYANDSALIEIGNALGGEITGGFTVRKDSVAEVAETLRKAGMGQVATQIERQAKIGDNNTVAIVNASLDEAGVKYKHERIHQVAADKQLPQSSIDQLMNDNGSLDNLINETEYADIKNLDPIDLVQEVLAYGLTGDYENMGVKPDTLYDALVDVIEQYVRAFPNEDVESIADNALINFNNIEAVAKRRITDEAKQNTTGKAETGKEQVRSDSKSDKGGTQAKSKVTGSITSQGLHALSAQTSRSVATLPVDEELSAIAQEYTKNNGLGDYEVGTNYNFKPEVYNQIADLMESNPHEPENPAVKASYKALSDETIAQYRYLDSKGYKFEPWLQEGQPYADSKAMRNDVIENKHLYFFIGGDMPANHPMKADSGIEIDGHKLVINDVFRAVHDWFGHAVSGAQFGARGELNATDSHARSFSREAIPALVGETVFQNAWVNYGPHIRREDGSIPVKGDSDFVPPQDRPFAEQKAMNITPEMVDLWLSAYTTPPRFNWQFKSAEEAGAGKLADVTRMREQLGAIDASRFGLRSRSNDTQLKRAVDKASKKQADELTTEDVELIIRDGKFVMITGSPSPEGLAAGEADRTDELRAELKRQGYTFLEADGVYAPEGVEASIEPSLFVVLRTNPDIANMIRTGTKYGQAQVLVGNSGEFRAPVTTTGVAGGRFEETFSKTGTVMFGDEALKQDGRTTVKTKDGDVTFSTPDAFSSVRKQHKDEIDIIKKMEKIFDASFKNPAKATSADLLTWLEERINNGQQEKLSVRSTAEFLEATTKKMLGGVREKQAKDAYDAQRVRRAVSDGLALVSHFQKGKSSQESGQSWYAASINAMHDKTGEAFPEVLNVPQLRALFDVVLAASSQGNTVEVNYNYATQLWRRIVEEFDLGTDTNSKDILPTKQKKGAKADNYGRFGPQMEKFNNMSRGYVPLDSLTAKKMKEKGIKADVIDSKDFKGVNGAPQKYIKSPELEASIKQYGRIGGVFEYLLQPGSTDEDPYKAQEILGPKIGAFFLNIAGFNQLVTVDMWAARWFYRINGGLVNEAQDKIQDTPKNTSDGDMIRGIMQSISDRWNATHENKLAPADIQAILWYGEKDVWTKAGAEDSGQVDFSMAANRYVPELVKDMDTSTLVAREKAVANFIAASPAPGPMTQKMGTEETTKEQRQYFIRQMSVPARLGLAATSRRQVMNRRLLNFDANEWNRMAEYAKGAPLEPGETTDLNRLLQNGYTANIKAQKDQAINDLQQFLDSVSQQSLAQFILAVRKAGLLSGLKTFGRNQISNFVFGALEESKRGVAAPIDMVISLATGKPRTVQGISPRAISYAMAKGFTEGLRSAKDTLIHGNTGATFETFNVGYDPKSGYKWLDNTVGQFAKYVFRLQGAGDAVGRTYAYHRALYEVGALSQKNNNGRTIADVLNNPTIEESDMAWRAAEIAVFQNDNAFNTAYQRMKSRQPGFVKAFLDFEAPFVKTGSNIFKKTMDYAVIGGVYDVAKALQDADIAQNLKGWEKVKEQWWSVIDTPETRATLVNAFSRGLVGLGIAYMGYRLAAAGLLYGMDDDDEKERNRRTAEGAGAGHIRIGDRWYDIRAFSPFAAMLLSGASYFRAQSKEIKDEGKRPQLYSAILTSMIVDGLPLARQAGDVLSNKATSPLMERMVALDSWVPSILNEVGQMTDDVQRDTKGEGFIETQVNKAKSKIPGLRKSLPVKEDALGNPLPQPKGFDPFSSKKANDSPVLKEIGKTGWSLTGVDRKTDDKGNKEPMDEFRERKARVSKMIFNALERAIASQEYPKTETPKERKKVLDAVAEYAREEVKEAEQPTKDEMMSAVEMILRKRAEQKEIENDSSLDKAEKKKALSRIGRKYGKEIKATTEKDEE